MPGLTRASTFCGEVARKLGTQRPLELNMLIAEGLTQQAGGQARERALAPAGEDCSSACRLPELHHAA